MSNVYYHRASSTSHDSSSSAQTELTDTRMACYASVIIIVVLATIALYITALAYQIRVLTGHAAGPMLPITMTAACLLGAGTLSLVMFTNNQRTKQQFLLIAASAITTIALAACCYRGVFSASTFAKAALITSGAHWGLAMWLGCCMKKESWQPLPPINWSP